MTNSPEKEGLSPPLVSPSEWKRRRFRLDIALVLLFASLIYVLLPGGDTEVDKAAVIPLVAGIVGLIGSYVFGAVWDDKNYMNAITQNPYQSYYNDPGMN